MYQVESHSSPQPAKMLLVAAEIRNAGLELAEPDDLFECHLGRTLNFAKCEDTLSNDFGIAPPVSTLKSSHDLSSMGIEARVYDSGHAAYTIANAGSRQSRIFPTSDRFSAER